MADRKLTPKQALFAAEYLKDLNASQAAIRAGYSSKNANVVGPRLLANVRIAAAIREALDARSQRTEITVDRVLLELGRIAFSDNRAIYREDGSLKAPHEWPDEVAAAIGGIETVTIGSQDDPATVRKLKAWDKTKALELLGRHLGMWNDKLDVNVGGLAERLAAARKRAAGKE